MGILLVLVLPMTSCLDKRAEGAASTSTIAYIPYWIVNPPDAYGHPMAETGLVVANIGNVKQTITITFFNMDGSQPASLPYDYDLGGITGSSSTDQYGRVVVTLPPLNTVAISLRDNGVLRRGFGTISGEVPGSTVASVLLNFPEDISLMAQTFTINGGNPF